MRATDAPKPGSGRLTIPRLGGEARPIQTLQAPIGNNIRLLQSTRHRICYSLLHNSLLHGIHQGSGKCGGALFSADSYRAGGSQGARQNGTMIPSAIQSLPAIAGKIAGRRPALFLDYDGTLTPIAARPELAQLSPAMRGIVSRLGNLCPVAVVSGRGREDVERLVGLDSDSIYFAGSHGFDIKGPGGREMDPGQGEAFVPQLRRAEAEIRARLDGIEGALVESKKYAFTVHYRLVSEAGRPRLDQAVAEVAGHYADLRTKGGKMVHEFLPGVDWHKGKAVNWLLTALELDGEDVLPFYLGDDLTDEDAFAVVRDKGIGILVAESPRETKARYALRDVAEVATFLEALAGVIEDLSG